MSNLGYGMSMGDIEHAMGWDCEPIIDDVTDTGCEYQCEGKNCEAKAVAELSWPMEDHDLPTGFFCQGCLDAMESKNWEES